MPPAVTVAGPDLVTARSADAFTVVLNDDVLFVGVGSGVLDDTVALFVIEPPWLGAVTLMVNVVEEPDAQVARVQVTEALPALVQVQPPLEALTDTNVTPAGRVSVTETLAAADGPLLDTTSE